MVETANTRLSAFDFRRDIERLTRDFTGRDWVMAEIDNWLQREAERFFILTGEPGVGKSAIAARLLQLRQNVVAHHFCIAGRNATITPGSVLRSLGAQLGNALEGYGEALANTIKPEHLTVNVDIKVEKMTGGEITGVVINHLHAGDPQEVFDILLRAPLAELAPPSEPIFILIDSLDEAVTFAGKTNLVTLLAGAGDLPSWVRFLCTSRPERRVLSYFDGLKPHALAAESQMNQEDINLYIVDRVKRQRLQTLLQSSNTPSQELVDQMRKLSKGNFLYTKILFDDIEAGRQPLDDLEALPKSLDEIYHGFLRRFTPAEWRSEYQPILGVLVVSQEAVTETQLANFTGIAETQMRQNLGVLLQFLDVIENKDQETYEIYHQSLRDYLLDKKRSKDFWCAAADGHRAIANYYLRHHEGKWLQCDAYGLRHLPIHLSSTEQIEILKKLLLDFNWLWAKLNALDVNAVIDDFDLLPDDREDSELQLLQSALRLSSNQLTRDRGQLTGHLWGRLMSQESSGLKALIKQAKQAKEGPWLRPLFPTLTPPGGPLLRTLEGHSGWVRAVAISPDGKTAVSGAMDNTLKLWDLASGEAVHTLDGHSGRVDAVAISPDGKTAVSGSVDQTLKVWDLASGEVVHTLEGHSGSVTAVAISPDGKTAVSGSWDQTLKVWDLASGEAVHTLEGHSGSVTAVAISPDGKTAVSGSWDQTLKVWDLASGEVVHTLEGHSDWVYAVAISPDGKTAVSGSGDQTLKVWDLASGEVVHTLEGHSDSVYAVAISPDGKTAVSGSVDQTLKVWDLASGEAVHTLEGHSDSVYAVAISPDGKTAVSGSLDDTLKLWDLASGEVVRTLKGHSDEVNAVAISPDGKTAVSGSVDKTLKLWDLASGEVVHTLEGHSGWVRAVAISPDGKTAVSGSDDNTLKLWDLASGEVVHTLEGHSKRVTAVAISPDGKTAVSGSGDNTLRAWTLEAGVEISAFIGESAMSTCAISPDGRIIVAGEASGQLHILRLEGI